MTEPDQEDFEAIEKQYGALPERASDGQIAHHYRLAQAHKLARTLKKVDEMKGAKETDSSSD